MKITEAHLRRLVRALLTEAAPPPDEPGVAPDEALGQYVFPNDRLHWVPSTLEDNTPLEDEFYRALERHYDNNERGALAKIWPEIVELNRAGLYAELLRAPRGKAFRLMEVDPARAALFMGVDEETIRANPRVAQVAPSPPPFKPKGLLSSWTMDPETMVEHTGPEFLQAKPGKCSLIFVANTSGGEFLMNPEGFAKGWKLGSNYALEYEVIAGGPVRVDSAAWIFHPEPALSKREALEGALDGAHTRLDGAEQLLRMRAADEGLDEDAVRTAEAPIWVEFCRALLGAIAESVGSMAELERGSGSSPLINELKRGLNKGEFYDYAGTRATGETWMSERALELADMSRGRFTQGMPRSPTTKRMAPDAVLEALLHAVGE